MSDKKLFLLDGMALIYRAHFAFINNPRITSYGLNTSAVFGFCNTLLDVIKKEKPHHLAVVFDTAAPTERHLEYPLYKAQREAMPEDLSKAIPYIFRLVEAFNIPVIKMDGYEADDIIGTLAVQAAQEGYTTYMMTPDKDFAQLVAPNIFIYKPARLGNGVEIMGVDEVLKKWEITDVKQVIDILGLWGDASDNIPGVPGVGEKTSKILIAQYGSMENILANTDKLKGKQKENFENFREQALLSKRLATININVPLKLEDFNLIMEPVDKEKTEALFNELEFRTLMKRVLGSDVAEPALQPILKPAKAKVDTGQMDIFGTPAAPAETVVVKPLEPQTTQEHYETIATRKHNYILIDTPELRKELIAKMAQQTNICFDTETTSIEPVKADIVGLSFSFVDAEAYYIPLPEDYNEAKIILEEFKPIFENETIEKTGQNIKYDYIILKRYDIELKGKFFDTMLAHYLMEPDMRHNMDALAMAYLYYKPVSISELIGKKSGLQSSFRNVDIEVAKDYAAEDADITLQLRKFFEPKLDERNIRNLLYDIEQPLISVLADMEFEGVKIDTAFLNNYSVELKEQIIIAEQEIYRCAGMTFNTASPLQLGKVLFEHMKLSEKPKKTATGQYKTDEDVLQSLSQHEIVKHILDFRQLSKLKSTYVDALPLLVNPATGRVHTSFNQAVAATGRLSSTNPNLQNIPIRTDLGKEVRKAFIRRDENYTLLSADYSQIELRIIAHISNDENMKEAFRSGHDIHTATAARIYNIPMEEVTKDQRRNAKSVNFGIVYGISPFGLANNLGIPRKEAAEIIENYFKTYPGVKDYMNTTIDFAKQNGFVETILGRRRYLRDINSANAVNRGFAERNAINAPIQGSAADMIKIAMIKLHKRLKTENLKTKMILQVHDELLFDVPLNEVEIAKKIITEEMSQAIPMSIPIEAEAGTGNNWLEAH
ncbi:MAG: DNA polymerase I [Bacteroidota bacterium]|nr:DNA polymerase I [Bacteroidota bacterium]